MAQYQTQHESCNGTKINQIHQTTTIQLPSVYRIKSTLDTKSSHLLTISNDYKSFQIVPTSLPQRDFNKILITFIMSFIFYDS